MTEKSTRKDNVPVEVQEVDAKVKQQPWEWRKTCRSLIHTPACSAETEQIVHVKGDVL